MSRGLSPFFAFLLALLLLTPVAQAQAVSLSADTARVQIGDKMAWLKDEGGRLGIEDVAASRAFTPLAREINLGFTSAAIWLRVEVARTQHAPKQWLLEVTNPFHDDLRLYTQAPNGGFIERRAGDRLDRQLLEVDYRQAVFRLDLETEAPQTLWLRLQSVNSVSAQVLVWQPEAFHQAVRTETLSYGLFFGVYLTILIFHLFFWRWTREPVGGWYVLYVASNGMITLLAVGYFQQYSGWSGSVTDAMIGILTCSAIWITTMFAVMQVDLGSVMPRTRRALVYGSAALSAPFAALTLGVSYPAGVVPAQLVSMGWGLMMLALPLWLWWRGHAPARFFALAFGVFIAGSVLHYLRTLGLVQPNLLTDYGYQIGSVIHMLMMSLAITGHYSAKKAQRLEAQMTANASLETQVVQRTKLLSTEVDQRRKLEFELRQALAVEQAAARLCGDGVA
jgi:hypothetical protein